MNFDFRLRVNNAFLPTVRRQVYYISLCSSIGIWLPPLPPPPRLPTEFMDAPQAVHYLIDIDSYR